ncbi:MAG: hypothetical protein FJ095_19625 [Deltaproteobacteria bacterium]|nr:hypothetical protein [Deltaproteobacteria bacterium]
MITLVVVALVVAGVVAWLFTGYGAPVLREATLGAREQALVAAVADAFFPPGGPIPLSGTQAGLVRYFDGYVGRSEPFPRFMLRLLLIYAELEPLIFGPRHVRFTRLTQDERLAALESAGLSSIYFRRVTFISMRAVMTMGYLANAEVAKAMRMTSEADPFGLGDRVVEDEYPVSPEAHP